jgi:WD40 repeat protein/mono/diheme cytochrome c family protein
MLRHSLAAALVAFVSIGSLSADEAKPKVSFFKQIRPIFQAHCQGCHQPAKPSGKYVLTSFESLTRKGESDQPAIVPGKPDDSYLVELITAEDGQAEMPKGKKPLHETQVDLIKTWISEGAVNDTPASANVRYDTKNPPKYALPPVVTSIDFSPDGKLIAVSGFNEVLLHKADGSGIVARLIGLSERIESVRFSHDGSRLAVAGGKPGRLGEIQVWDVAKKTLLLSAPYTYDTLYGASWSPDDSKIAFGCTDKTLRAIDAKTGKQVLYQGAHSDWILDTIWNPAGDHLISVSRDRTAKLTEFATQRFIDNITSITPKALKGGVETVDTHPTRDEIIIGGADGIPKLFRIFRITKRVIGDNANLIRALPALRGRVFGVDYSHDGRRVVAGSSLDGKGEIVIYDTDVDTNAPADIKAILAKRVMAQNAAEKKKLAAYQRKPLPELARIKVEDSGIYAVRFSPDGKIVAAAGSNGKIRLYDAENGKLIKEFLSVPLTETTQAESNSFTARLTKVEQSKEPIHKDDQVVSLSSVSNSIKLTGAFEKAQLVIRGKLKNGTWLDVTRSVDFKVANEKLVSVSNSGLIQVLASGKTEIAASLAGHSVKIGVEVTSASVQKVDYIRDVMPVMSKLGCNAGTCHGSKDGKNGFKLSLRGYDPIYDTRALTDELASRRVNIASPENSLMILKSDGSAPHVGGQVVEIGTPYYEIMKRWIGGGAKLDLTSARVVSIDVTPKNPIVQRLGGKQQMRILATYSNGDVRDVTAEAFIESGNRDVAKTDPTGLVLTERRGEAPILARFEGRYAATTVTVMGDRTGFVWAEPEKWNFVDEHVARKLERMKIHSSGLCSDTHFVRRVYFDLTGLPPSTEAVKAFVADKQDSKTKRYALVDQLIGTPEFIDHWTNKWADLLQVNRKYLAPQGAKAFREWIRKEVADNTPYDKFAYKVLTSKGSNKDNPEASYYKILRTPAETMENTTHLWLAVRFNCNKCHDHPFEKWTQDQYYETAAFFAQYGLKADPASGKKKIGGTAVEGAKPLYEIVFDKKEGEIKHDRTGVVTAPKFPYECNYTAPENATRREHIASWITAPDNRYFAKSYVNRVWGYLMGVGMIEPLDDIRAGNPPTNPELLDDLTKRFVEGGFNIRELMQNVCKSRTYNLELKTNEWNVDDKTNYSHAIPKRLTAEMLYDAIHRVTGSQPKIPGVPPGTRAAQLPDAGVKLPDSFLASFGRPARESACECERSAGVSLGPVMALVSGPTVGNAIGDPNNAIAKLVKTEKDDRKLISAIFMRVLNREAEEEEIDVVLKSVANIERDHKLLSEQRAARDKWWKGEKPRLEQLRKDSIASSEKDLAAFVKSSEPKTKAAEKTRADLIVLREKELKAFQNGVTKRANGFLAKNNKVKWTHLTPDTVASNNKIKLEKLENDVIKASGGEKNSTYTLTFNTDAINITGLRIEALPNPKLKGGGPGLPPNGNFVVTEFEVHAGPQGKLKEVKKVALQNAKADFLQKAFNIGLITDGKPGNQNAWAIANAGGVVHWATVETKKPINFKGGTTFKILIHQNHTAANHLLGSFRISVTSDKAPIGTSLPESLQAIAAVEEAKRTKAQTDELLAYFGKSDGGLVAKQNALNAAKAPVPVDPGVAARTKTLDFLKKPVPEDSQLARLRQDLEQSKKQLGTLRLTAAQDLTWVLINTPEFLFNH